MILLALYLRIYFMTTGRIAEEIKVPTGKRVRVISHGGFISRIQCVSHIAANRRRLRDALVNGPQQTYNI